MPRESHPRGLSVWINRHSLATILGAVVLALTGVWGVKLAQLAHSVEAYRTYWSVPRGTPGDAFWNEMKRSPALRAERATLVPRTSD